VGTGFTFKQRGDLKKQLDKIARQTSPIAVLPKDPGLRETHWTEPQLIADVAFMEWTSDGSIRHPSFQDLREDKNANEVIREQPAAAASKSKAKAKATTKRNSKSKK
jgi:bifunctional non-homologous end joining protein LigD